MWFQVSIISHWKMCSSIVQNSFQYLIFSLFVLVVGVAFEELLPKFLGVGFPVLLSAVYCVSERRDPMVAVLFAIVAGGMSDAVSSLPPMTSSGFFMLVVLLTRISPFPILLMVALYPLYQVWLKVIVPFAMEQANARSLQTTRPFVDSISGTDWLE